MIRHTALVIIAMLMSGSAIAQSPSSDIPEVLVLGTFHFTGGGSDMINSEVDDFLSPQRQMEISEVLDRLEQFAPTKILVELTPDGEADFNARYQHYLSGEHELTVNERQQIGMALAARLGHDRLYAVDYPSGMDFDGMFAAAQASEQTGLLASFEAFTTPIRTRVSEQDNPSHSVLERLVLNNNEETRAFHHLYLITAQMGSDDDPKGAIEMTNWWGRNLQIYANVARIAEPEDRLLVIYGSGHKYLLDQFFDGAPNLVWVDALDYLQ
jgi:hypothetical protein